MPRAPLSFTSRIGLRILLAASTIGGASASVQAQAYCALRDPVGKIRELYPDAQAHCSLVREIDGSTRKGVSERLGIDLHFSELGRHTLYIVRNGWRPLGLVHVRAEQGRRGLVEIAWSLDLELRLVDFRLQRCRERGKDAVEDPRFRALLRGRDQNAVRALLNADGDSLSSDVEIAAESRDLASVIVRCALKTQVITSLAWGEDLLQENMKARAAELWPEADGFEWIDEPPVADEEIAKLLTDAAERRSVRVLQVCSGDRVVGTVIHTMLPVARGCLSGLWSVDEHGEIVDVYALGGWPDAVAESDYRGTDEGGRSVSRSPASERIAAGVARIWKVQTP